MPGNRLGLFGQPSPEEIMSSIGRVDPADISVANLGINAPVAIGMGTRRLATQVPALLKAKQQQSQLADIAKQAGDPTKPVEYYGNLAQQLLQAGMPDQASMAIEKLREARQEQNVADTNIGNLGLRGKELEFDKTKLTADTILKSIANSIKSNLATEAKRRNDLTEQANEIRDRYQTELIKIKKAKLPASKAKSKIRQLQYDLLSSAMTKMYNNDPMNPKLRKGQAVTPDMLNAEQLKDLAGIMRTMKSPLSPMDMIGERDPWEGVLDNLGDVGKLGGQIETYDWSN